MPPKKQPKKRKPRSKAPRAPIRRAALTEREEKFVFFHVIEGMSPVDSIVAAGYGATSLQNKYHEAARVIARPLVKKRIDELLKDRDRQFLVDKKLIVDRLKKIVVEQAGTKQELKALELLGKSIGLWSERIDLTTGNHAAEADEAWEKRKKKIVTNEPDEALLLGILKERKELKDEQEDIQD